MLLLRYCHTTRLNHLAWGVCPETLEPMIHDQQTKSTFTTLLRFGDISDPSWVQATLPVRLGGIGLISLQKILPFAYLSGWAHSLQSLPDRFLICVIRSAICWHPLIRSPVLAPASINQSLPTAHNLSDRLSNTKKL